MIEDHIDFLQKHGIQLKQHHLEKLNKFAKLILQWNRKINLTAARSIEDLIKRHLLDSLMPITIGFFREKEVIDLGSGGGFPAIPLSIYLENIRFILIEKVSKKCAFLNKVKRELSLNKIEIINKPFESLCNPIPSSLITRAVKIDRKMLDKFREKGIIWYYSFETEKPLKGLFCQYTLPGEEKIRFVVKRKTDEK